MALQTRVGSFTVPLATGNKAITGLGFQPIAIIFYGNARSSDGASSSATINPDMPNYIGFAVSSSSRVVITNDDDASSASSISTEDTTKCIKLLEIGVLKFAADFVSMDADGFTVNFTTGFATADLVNFLAIGGADVTNAAILSIASQAGTGHQSFTGAGFTPGCAIFLGQQAINSNQNVGLGFASGASNQGATFYSFNGSIPATDIYQRTSNCFHYVNNGAVKREAQFVSFDADGVTINWSTASTGQNVYALVLKGGKYFVGNFTQKTSSGTQATTGVGFPPTGLLLANDHHVASTTLVGAAQLALMLGAASDSTHRGVIFYGSGSDGEADLNRTAIYVSYADDTTPTLEAAADLSSFDNDGFTLNYSSADGTARQILFLAMGSNTPTIPPGLGTSLPASYALAPGPTYPIDLRTFTNVLRQLQIGKDKVFGAAGETQTYDWPNPQYPAWSVDLRTWLQTAQDLPVPSSNIRDQPLVPGPTYPIDLRTALASLPLNLRNKDLFFGGAGQPVANLDQPASRPAIYSNELRTWLVNLLQSELNIPPLSYDWPLPKWPAWEVGLGTFLNSVEIQLIGKDKFFGGAGQPIANLDQPASPPALYHPHLRTWLDSLQESTLAPSGLNPIDISNKGIDRPLVPGPTWSGDLRTWLQYYVIDTNVPFAQTDHPLPRGSIYAEGLRTWLTQTPFLLIGLDKIFGGPGQTTTYDWPTPQHPRWAENLRTWLSVPIETEKLPHALYDWPLVAQATYPVDLRSSIFVNLTQTLLAPVPSPPKYFHLEWPLVRPAEYPNALRTWLQTRFGALIEPLPYNQFDHPLPKWPVYPTELRTHLHLNTILTELAPVPIENFDQPLPRGPLYPFDLRTHLGAVSLTLLGKDKIYGGAGQPLTNTDWPNPVYPVFPIVNRTHLVNLLQFTLKPPSVGGALDPELHYLGGGPNLSYSHRGSIGGLLGSS